MDDFKLFWETKHSLRKRSELFSTAFDSSLKNIQIEYKKFLDKSVEATIRTFFDKSIFDEYVEEDEKLKKNPTFNKRRIELEINLEKF